MHQVKMPLNRCHSNISPVMVLIFLACPFFLFTQTDSVLYTSEFKFVDGIYKTFEEFKQNRPSLKVKAKATENIDKKMTFGVQEESLYYSDSLGNPIFLNHKDVWGYCLNGVVYVKFQHRYHRLFKIAAISLFSEEPTSDPTLGLVPASTGLVISGFPYTDNLFPFNDDSKHYLLDFYTGLLYYHNLAVIEQLLEKDKALHAEFMSIKKAKERKKRMFIYLRKFNERNPIYIKKKQDS